MQERVQKILSNAGYIARRKAEELIEQGRITVNGKTIILGDKADADKDIIKVDGERIKTKTRKIYLAMNKPKFYLVSTAREGNKRTIYDLLDLKERVYPVGRLDFDAEGLILLTNDGDFANKVMHPRYEKEKTYLIKTRDPLDEHMMKNLKEIAIEGRIVNVKTRVINNNTLEMTIHEGRKHVVKRIMFKLGYFVKNLKRTKIGKIELGKIKSGQYRPLTDEEIKAVTS